MSRKIKKIVIVVLLVILLLIIIMPRLVAESTAFVQNTVVYDSSEEKALSQATIRQEEDEILSDWRLILVNPWNFLPSTYSVSLVEIENEQSVDERCSSELQEMLADCRLAGYSPFICSSYRSYEKQEQLYNKKVNKLIARGYSESEAKKEAATVNAIIYEPWHYRYVGKEAAKEIYESGMCLEEYLESLK